MRSTFPTCVAAAVLLAAPLFAQSGMVHTPGMQHRPGMHDTVAVTTQPTHGGQAVFAAVTEIVKLLEADATTDWSKVDITALRQHLIDMDNVTMRARVQTVNVPGGLEMLVTGDAVVAASIRRMVGSHAPMLEALGGWRASTAAVPGGLRFTVVASDPADTARVTRIRGLGFMGLMVQGAHHTQHHLMIAKGAGAHAHGR